MQSQTGQDVLADIDAVNESVDLLYTHNEQEFCSMMDDAQSQIDSSDLYTDGLQSRTELTSDQMSSNLDDLGVCGVDDAQLSTDQGIDAISQNTELAQTSLSEFTVEQQRHLEEQTRTLEQEVEARRDTFATKIDDFITAEAEKLRKRLNATIKILEDEAKADEAEVWKQSQAWAGNPSQAAVDEADRLAGVAAGARVKKRYAEAMHRVADAAIEDLLAQRGEPSALISGALHAPTLDQLWPAHQQQLTQQEEEKKKRDAEIKTAGERFKTVTTNTNEVQAQAVEDQVCLADETLMSAQETAQETLQSSTDQTEAQVNEVTTVLADEQQQRQEGMQDLM
ncbi:MAG TPA: hypothetical protein PKW90_29450, partial [Myxococcota bacterium]|nr:hypothetical protein [Myxococcota bacterium]